MAREDALYESGMPLDALNLPPSVSTHDNFDVSDDHLVRRLSQENA